MKRMWLVFALAGLALIARPLGAADDVATEAPAAEAATATEAATAPATDGATEKFDVDIHGRMQWLAVAEHMNDPFRNNDRLYLFMKQARLRFTGNYKDVRFDVNTAYGGEDAIAASPGVTLGLLDFSFDAPLPLDTRVKIGQFRVPYGRERITDAGTLNFADRSIVANAFSWNRDVGIALHTRRGRFAALAGLFTGGGRDVPQRYLPEKLAPRCS